MAKKKKKKQAVKKKPSLFKFPSVSIPESAKRLIWAVVFFALALIFSFAFFEKAGMAGNLLLQGAIALTGRTVFLLPLFFVIGGLVLWGSKRYSIAPVFFSLFLLTLATAPIIPLVARVKRKSEKNTGAMM